MTTRTAARRTRPSRQVRGVAAASIALAMGLGLSACGDDADGSASDADLASAEQTTAGDQPTSGSEPTGSEGSGDDDAVEFTPTGTLPAPPTGVVRVDGSADSLTSAARAGYATNPSGTTVTQETSGDARGFERLCLGDVDVVDSTRSLTAEEYAQCEANGLQVVQFQVAADAIVLAIRSQTDVGSDCLSVDQVRAAVRAGSSVTNWSQLGNGFDDVKFEAGGPTVEEPAARFFARYVLDNPEPVNADFRADYEGTRTEDRTRLFVTGSDRDRRLIGDLSYVEPVYTDAKALVKKEWGDWARANLEVRRAVAQQRQGIRDKWTPAERAATDRRVTRAYAWRGREITQVNAARAFLRPWEERYDELVQIQARIADELGHLGLFSHGYYATYEDRLRPFEIDVADGDDEPNCIFPSPQTILNGDYPLSRQLLLTTTTRSLARPIVREFLSYYIERSGELADAAGVIPLPDADRERQLTWLEEDADLPEFRFFDGELREETEADRAREAESQDEEPAPPVQNPAR